MSGAPPPGAGPGIARLLEVMARLRDPDGGCPWDLEQSFETIAPYTIEEAYEVAEAIRLGDRAALRDELGDLLLQVVFHAQMAREDGSFDFDEVADGIAEKMIRRHPTSSARTTPRRAARRRRRCGPGRPKRPPSGTHARRPKAGRPARSTAWRSPSLPCCAPKSCRSGRRAWASTGRRPPRSSTRCWRKWRSSGEARRGEGRRP